LLRINLAEAKEKPGEVIQYHFTTLMPPLEGVGERISFTEPAVVDVRVTSMGTVFWVEGTIKTAVMLTCSRCLKQFVYPLQTAFSDKYRFGAVRANTPQPDADTTLVAGENLDLTDKVKESILLALPMKALCDKACKGLCPQCGQDLNKGECTCRREASDPRLAVLARLLENDEQKEVT